MSDYSYSYSMKRALKVCIISTYCTYYCWDDDCKFYVIRLITSTRHADALFWIFSFKKIHRLEIGECVVEGRIRTQLWTWSSYCKLSISGRHHDNQSFMYNAIVALRWTTDIFEMIGTRPCNPFENASCMSKLFFTWPQKLLQEGLIKPIEEKDLPGKWALYELDQPITARTLACWSHVLLFVHPFVLF